jgi:hypothetical protein
MNKKEVISTSTGDYYIKDGILFIDFYEDADLNLEAAKEGIAARKELQQGEKMLILCDTSKVWQVTNESREYSAEQEADGMNRAMAIVTGSSFVAVTAANFFIKMNKPQTPTKVFKSREKALKWLKQFQ